MWVYFIWPLLCWGVLPLYAHFLGNFFFYIMNGCWILSKAFPTFIEMIIWLLFFSLLYHTDLSANVEKTLNPWDESHLIMICDPFNALLDSVCQYFAGDFCICVHQWYVVVQLFSCSVVSNSLQVHGIQQARLPCPSPSPRVCSNSRPLSQWCHPTML